MTINKSLSKYKTKSIITIGMINFEFAEDYIYHHINRISKKK